MSGKGAKGLSGKGAKGTMKSLADGKKKVCPSLFSVPRPLSSCPLPGARGAA
jgi:hypothetical protein